MPSTTRVRDVMTRDVATLRPDQPIAEAADALAAGRYGAMPVVDADGRFVGLLRDEDLIASESARARADLPHAPRARRCRCRGACAASSTSSTSSRARPSAEVMDEHPHTVTSDATMEDVATLMHEGDVTHVPVVDDGRVVGLVARSDIVRFIARTT